MTTRRKKKEPSKVEAVVRPAYFLELNVENIRCFGLKQTLDLSDGNGHPARWTIILGNNGVGKTTLLQSLAALTPVHRVFTDDLTFLPKGFPVPHTGKFTDWAPYRGSGESVAKISSQVCSGADFIHRKRPLATGGIYLNWNHSQRSVQTDRIDSKFSNLDCYGYGAVRKMSATQFSGEKSDDPTGSLYREEIALRNPEEWLLQLEYTATKKSPVQKEARIRRGQVKDILKRILPDVSDIRFPSPKDADEKPSIEFETPYGWVSIQNLGLGYRTMIAWMVDLASRLFERYPESSDPIAEPAIVLVDEIDLHMHPHWQRTIMKFLSERFLNTQFIVTAHSPLIVQAAEGANIAVLKREGDHVVIDQSFQGIRGWRIDQLLTSDLFGLETARPAEYEKLLNERKRIMTKSRVTKKDRDKLRAINAEIGDLPAGETFGDVEAMDIIRRAAARIKMNDDAAE